MKRAEIFTSLRDHAWYKTFFTKLRKSDVAFCELFIEQTEDLEVSSYVRRVRGLTEQLSKNKNVLLIEELLFISRGS